MYVNGKVWRTHVDGNQIWNWHKMCMAVDFIYKLNDEVHTIDASQGYKIQVWKNALARVNHDTLAPIRRRSARIPLSLSPR